MDILWSPKRITSLKEWSKSGLTVMSGSQSTRYLLQVVKCQQRSCCSAQRTEYEKISGSRFLPPPIPLRQLRVDQLLGETVLLIFWLPLSKSLAE